MSEVNEHLPKEWDNPQVRREIAASSAHIGAMLDQLNRTLRSPTLERSIEWLQWLNMAAVTYEVNGHS